MEIKCLKIDAQGVFFSQEIGRVKPSGHYVPAVLGRWVGNWLARRRWKIGRRKKEKVQPKERKRFLSLLVESCVNLTYSSFGPTALTRSIHPQGGVQCVYFTPLWRWCKVRVLQHPNVSEGFSPNELYVRFRRANVTYYARKALAFRAKRKKRSP